LRGRCPRPCWAPLLGCTLARAGGSLRPGGGWENPAYLIIVSLAQALLGDGAYALVPSWGFCVQGKKN
jgi:hypothetical protein